MCSRLEEVCHLHHISNILSCSPFAVAVLCVSAGGDSERAFMLNVKRKYDEEDAKRKLRLMLSWRLTCKIPNSTKFINFFEAF